MHDVVISVPQSVSTSKYPAHEDFRACAGVLVTLLADDFVLDPPKLGSPGLFFEATNPIATQNRTSQPILALDIGGLQTGMVIEMQNGMIGLNSCRCIYCMLGYNTGLQTSESGSQTGWSSGYRTSNGI